MIEQSSWDRRKDKSPAYYVDQWGVLYEVDAEPKPDSGLRPLYWETKEENENVE